jgi:endonuclease YncB( thermonuclease family)
MNKLRTILAVSFLCCIALYAPADIVGRVVSVTDGDTIKVLDANQVQYKVRLTGIDAPERKQPYSTASRKHLASLVEGRQVVVESSRSDRYGRILGKVWVEDIDVNLEQVRAGYAWWYRYYSKEQPSADRTSYELAEDTAKEQNSGLWAAPNPVTPYDWRKGRRK